MRGDPPSDVYRTSAVHIQQHETIEFLKIGDPPSDVKSIDPQSDPPCDVYVTRGRGTLKHVTEGFKLFEHSLISKSHGFHVALY